FLGTVADRNHEVPWLPLQPVDAARGAAGPRDVVFTQRLDCVRIHAIGGARPGALGVESSSALTVEQGLGHLAPGRIAGTEEEDAEPRVMRAVSAPERTPP